MWQWWILKLIITALLSLIVVFIIHSLYTHFKDTLTEKKTKDVIRTQLEKYQKYYPSEKQGSISSSINNTPTPTIERVELTTEMEEELLEYAKKLI